MQRYICLKVQTSEAVLKRKALEAFFLSSAKAYTYEETSKNYN
jgi:hypothetical protein